MNNVFYAYLAFCKAKTHSWSFPVFADLNMIIKDPKDTEKVNNNDRAISVTRQDYRFLNRFCGTGASTG